MNATLELVETRSAQVAEVDFPKRIVTVVAMPYEQPTQIYEPGGRSYTEVVSRGAFDGIEKRASRIRANRDHSWEKPVGRVVSVHPSRKEGLVADVKMASTLLGDDTLTLCDEGVLDASAGFGLLRRDDGRIYEDAEVWERDRTLRRLNRLWLDHLALVPNPAYPGAEVLSVRNTSPGTQEARGGDETPNLDQHLSAAQIAAQRAAYEELNARWARSRV